MAPHLDGPPSTCDLSAQVLASVDTSCQEYERWDLSFSGSFS